VAFATMKPFSKMDFADSSSGNQGCQIFIVTIYQKRGKIHQMTTNYIFKKYQMALK
jgi:hypothetical protein